MIAAAKRNAVMRASGRLLCSFNFHQRCSAFHALCRFQMDRRPNVRFGNELGRWLGAFGPSERRLRGPLDQDLASSEHVVPVLAARPKCEARGTYARLLSMLKEALREKAVPLSGPGRYGAWRGIGIV